MNKPVNFIHLAGSGAARDWGSFALEFPHRARFTAVVDADRTRREAFAAEHNIAKNRQYGTLKQVLQEGRLADAAVISVAETERAAAILGMLGAGYDVMTETPLALTAADVTAISDAARKGDAILAAFHPLRHHSLFRTVRQMILSGAFGRVLGVELTRTLNHVAMAHYHVRGVLNTQAALPLMGACAGTELDLLRGWADCRPKKVCSSGALTHFKADRAPQGGPAFCLDGCPIQRDCPYYVVRVYGDVGTEPSLVRQIGAFKERHELWHTLRNNRYGRCVYKCDNDVLDFQAVAIEFEGGVTAHLTVSGMGGEDARMARILLDNGLIEIDSRNGSIRAATLNPPMRRDVESVGAPSDPIRAMLDAFIDAVGSRDRRLLPAPFGASLDGHWMAFAAEESRLTGKWVDLRNQDGGRGRN
jgi:predicted dehydrogenase